MDDFNSILKKLPDENQAQITQLITKQQKSIALHQELIKQLNQEMVLSKVVLNAVGEGIIAIDENHNIIDLNPALAKMFGYTGRELKGQNLDVLLPGKMGKTHLKNMHEPGKQLQALIAGERLGDKIYGLHKTKGRFRVSITISHGISRDEKVYTGIVRDLTQQDQLEQENKKHSEKLINRAKELEGLYNLIKLREEDSVPAIIKKLFTEIVPKTTKYPEKAVTIVEHEGHTYRSRAEEPVVSLSSKLHNGSITFGFIRGIPYGTSQHQKLLDTFTAEFDLALLQMKAEERELQAERKAAMGELSTGVAHNINNGLQIIQGYAQVALGLAGTEDIKEPLIKIRDKSQELGANVRGILRSTNYKPDKGHFEIFDLGELLSDYLTGAENPLKSEALRQGATVTINRQIGAGTSINGDKGEITLITQALIKNSIDSFLEDGEMDIDVIRKGEYVHLQVKDTGIGMSAEIQQKLFEPHFTSKGFELQKGLSLHTAQKMAREHGGEIKLLKSQVGLGTTIELKLPYAQRQEVEKLQVSSRIKQLSILWAEDDCIIQETVKMMTKSLDDQIDFVENGKIAIDMLRRKPYDVLITDIGMPVMGGWKLLKSIEGRYENMPRVLASGYIINTEDMTESGASYLLNKPLEKNDLISILDNIKNKPQHSQRSGMSYSSYAH